MYEITSCQISHGNEDDKVVPHIDHNYSCCPVLSPFPIMFMRRGREWFILCFVLYLLYFPMEYFQLTVLVNEKESLAATGSCMWKVSSQPLLWRLPV